MEPKIVPCAHRSPTGQWFNAKRIIVCCDGTWNSANARESGDPTNVARLSGAFAKKCCSGMPQLVYYHSGVGTETSKIAQYLGGIFGIGVAQNIVESYRFICDNYNPGDEIIIIGFSRGAFTARSVAGMICSLGFLNRSGLDQLPHIFHDYETWQDWGDAKYDPKDHLVGFTLENQKRLKRFEAAREREMNGVAKMPWSGSVEELQAKLDQRKRGLFETMSKLRCPAQDGDKRRVKGARAKMDIRKMAKEYRDMLVEQGMSLAKRIEEVDKDGKKVYKYVPVHGMVKAVGVWDTVGSLGIPRMPFHSGGRSEQEIRFEGLDVPFSVEYAFHALALDEWRTAFDCTMWGKRCNSATHLRQVWFPGSHCNAGGGWPDQQIATIALAWMADQLTSIGVEFSKVEMNRVFYELRPGAVPQKWALGTIRNPTGPTTYPDKIHGFLAAPYRYLKHGHAAYPTRRPGGDEPLEEPNELVHPCVRIRYLYGGAGMDDAGAWECRGLTSRGYTLQPRSAPDTPIRPCRVDSAVAPYHAVSGPVTPFYDTLPSNLTSTSTSTLAVRTEQPHDRYDLYPLPVPKTHWVWAKPDGSSVLPEEHIGMWERMFIKNNEKLLSWYAREQTAIQEERNKTGASSCNNRKPSLTSALRRIFKRGRGADPDPDPSSTIRVLAADMASEKMPIPTEYGYHDLVSWQQGDTTSNRPPRVGVGLGPAISKP